MLRSRRRCSGTRTLESKHENGSYGLLPTDFSVANTISKHYEYNADGRLRYSQHIGDDRFDRSYTYDHAGRLTAAFSGQKARGLSDTDDRPYRLTFNYDALNHLTSRTGRVWNTPHVGNIGSGIYLDRKNTGDIFGITTTGKEVFNGNALNNVRAGARILNSHGSGRRAAGLYRTGTGTFFKTKAGQAEFNRRAGQYDRYAPKYAAFFNCMEGT